jgi:hypothetical protein
VIDYATLEIGKATPTGNNNIRFFDAMCRSLLDTEVVELLLYARAIRFYQGTEFVSRDP